MKIIAFYLPQFHNIPENDEWWGDGFTEWTNVKKAKSLYPGHVQPKVPINNNYYNLLDDDVKEWQAKLARDYGIYGFCYYHYWFNGKMLLEKPMEQMLNNHSIDIPFCICWANEAWSKAWIGNEKKTLITQKYGGEKEWEEHFNYLLGFFKDERYILKDNKPVIVIYRPEVIEHLKEMLEYWSNLAKEAGFDGLTTMCTSGSTDLSYTDRFDLFDNIIEWQPHMAKTKNPVIIQSGLKKHISDLKMKLRIKYEMLFGVALSRSKLSRDKENGGIRFFDYDDVWKQIIKMKPISKKSLPGAFVRWDNSPRYGERATIIKGESPEKFGKYMSQQIRHAKEEYNTDFMFMYAWNEWAEGGYLEPDEEHGYEYLEAVRSALIENNEMP